MKLSQQKPEPIPYEEKNGYHNSLETDHWSEVATRILIRAVAIVALAFSIVWAFKSF